MTSDLRASYIRSLALRLEAILPNRTGYVLAEVELNAQFILISNLLYRNCRPSDANGHQNFMADIVECFTAILEKLNIDPATRKLKERDDKSLTSTLVVTELLATIVTRNWDTRKSYLQPDSRLIANGIDGIDFDFEPASHDEGLGLYAFPAPDLLLIDVQQVLEVLLTVLSGEVNRKALATIRRQNADSSTYNHSPDLELLPAEIATYNAGIDSHVLMILRYIAATNATDYYSFLTRKLFAWSERGEYIRTLALQKYACLLKYFYYIPDVTEPFLRQIYSCIPYIRLKSWKQIFLYYVSINLQSQCIHRPNFYAGMVYSGSAAEESCKLLFDFVSSVFEDDSMTSLSLYSWFVLTCPSDFDELLQKPNKLKQAFNKRVKYLSSVLKDAQAGGSLDSFESLINIFLLGSRIPQVKGGVREFSIRFLDETYANLKKMRFKQTCNGFQERYRTLMVEFYTAAIAINSEEYIPRFVKTFNETVQECRSVCSSDCSCIDLQDHLRVVQMLADMDCYRPYFSRLVKTIQESLRLVLYDARVKLAYFDKHRPNQSPSSSGISSPLERTPEAEKVLMHPVAQNLKRNNMDYGKGYIKEIVADESFAVLLTPGSPTHLARSLEVLQLKDHQDAPAELDFNMACINTMEEVFTAVLNIFASAPELYIYNDEKYDTSDPELHAKRLIEFCEEVSRPINLAIRFQSTNETPKLFEAACKLALKLLKPTNEEYINQSFLSFIISLHVIKATADACASFSLTDHRFKLCFIFLNSYFQERDRTFDDASDSLSSSPIVHTMCQSMCESLEALLILALCTHDVQFFGMAKITMRWYIIEITADFHNSKCFNNTLVKTFQRILDDNSVFTGFVSLHKKIRSILMDAEPARSLYHVWLLIYQRWLAMVEGSAHLNEESLVFRHYTGFLVSTSGCFLDAGFSNDLKYRETAIAMVSSFFDRAIGFLKSDELVIRVVIKDALSNESHSAVFHLICNKLINIVLYYVEQGQASDEALIYIDHVIPIISSMVAAKNEGSFALCALLPNALEVLISFINLVPNIVDHIKMKLRFCKLVLTIETDKTLSGILGAFKTRNFFAKASAEWLEQAIFYKSDNDSAADLLASPSSLTAGRTPEVEYLQVELASECSKCLELQLQSLVLELPDGTKESNIKQSKDLIFSNYFSLFYRILQKFASSTPSPSMMKSKYKIQTITDNTLKAISNILQSNADIGMQFAHPLGYHENEKIRSIFLGIFATMLISKKHTLEKEEFPEEIVYGLSDIYEVYGAAAQIASPAEHNLLATSLHGLFGYTKGLDKLFVLLLNNEITSVARASDIFRSNSTLTRLMSIFAKEYGLPYLTVVLRPFIEEMVDENVSFEVEKSTDEENVNLFIKYLTRLADAIVNSMPWVPDSFKFICAEIYKCIKEKFEDAALVAVGSFVFLRFFCPAIVSPESFFDLSISNIKVKRSLMQLVKVIQYMANGSIANLKFPGLGDKIKIVEDLNQKILGFLKKMAVDESVTSYPFHKLTMKPYTSLRYIHKFLYTYLSPIKHRYILSDPLANPGNLHERVVTWKKLDVIMLDLGNPKPYISLKGSNSYRVADTSANISNSQYAEFMAKMSAKNIEMAVETSVVQNAVFHDGTPTVVVNFRAIKDIGYDINTFVYLILETASQVWDNQFYCVLDFTQFFYMGIIGKNYVSLMRNYAPSSFFKNCARTYYFNLPRASYLYIIEEMVKLRLGTNYGNEEGKIYYYSQQDDPAIINTLCLDESITGINHDVRAVYKNCMLYDDITEQFTPVTLKLGRQWLQICFDKILHDRPHTATTTVSPVETHMLTDLTRCEISTKSKEANEFTLSLNKYNYQVTLVSPQRQEILRFLYFAMLRTTKQVTESTEEDEDIDEEKSLRFGNLFNLVFHGLLHKNDEVRSSAAQLFASLAEYFDFDLGLPSFHAKRVAFPIDTTDFIVTVSADLAKRLPENTYRFLKAFFNNFSKLPKDSRPSGILYISPWIENIWLHVFNDTDGTEKMENIVRQFCKITIQNKEILAFLNEALWKKLFAERALSPILVDEILAFAIENSSDDDDWGTIISVMDPSIELCGEVVARLNECIAKTSKEDSEIAIQSKQLEIKTLVKICSSLFFNSLVYGSLFLLDVFFFCTLFIDSPGLLFGSDLQRLVINTILSFSHKPGLTPKQRDLINKTIDYFSGQRAKMLFGLTSKERGVTSDLNQIFNRASSFEMLCDYLNDFIAQIGTADERIRWMTRWSSLSMNIAFSNSLFQKRAILAVCTLARSGISDSTAGRILKLLAGMIFDDDEFFSYAAICHYRLEEGLSADSAYLPFIIWLVSASMFIEIPSTYQAVATCLANVVRKMDAHEKFFHHVLGQRVHLEPLLGSFEDSVGARLTEKNFNLNVLFSLSKGLTVSQFKHTSLTCLKKVIDLKVLVSRSKNEEMSDEKGFELGVLLILYLSLPDASFQELLMELKLENVAKTWMGKDSIPAILVEEMCRDTEAAQVVLILAAWLFASDCDSVYKQKFVSFYNHLYKVKRKNALLVFHIVQTGLEDSLEHNNSIGTVNEISDLFVGVIQDKDYSVAECEKRVTAVAEYYSFPIINRVGCFHSDTTLNNTKMVASSKLIQDMLYRSFWGVIEGQKLEKF